MDYMGLSLSGDFNSKKIVIFNSFYLFITLLLSSKMSTLKSLKMMIGSTRFRYTRNIMVEAIPFKE